MKQVIVVNEALRLPRGKLAAQVAHASIASLITAAPDQQQSWFKDGMPKIVLDGISPEHLEDLFEQCQKAGLPAYLVRDAGKTLLVPGTLTCLGIGPADSDSIDKITGELKLLK